MHLRRPHLLVLGQLQGLRASFDSGIPPCAGPQLHGHGTGHSLLLPDVLRMYYYRCGGMLAGGGGAVLVYQT